MNALAANDIEAADLLARLDGDSSPAAAARRGHTLAARVPDVISTAQEPNDPRPLPETSSGHSAVARSPGHPPGDRQPGGDDRSTVRPRPPAAGAGPDGRRLAPRSPLSLPSPATIAAGRAG
jgi:hypothetical protein